jgi:hypothetical protein
LLGAVCAVGCGADGEGDRVGSIASSAATSEDACPISAVGRHILADFAFSSEHALEVATLGAGGGFAWSLVAAGPLPEAQASLAVGTDCEASSQVSAATCTAELGDTTAGVDLCFTTGCAAANVMVVDDYATSLPHPSTGDRASTSYASGPGYPSASVTYTPSPITHWRFDSTLGVTVVSATLAENPIVAFQSGETLDFTFNGEAGGVGSGSSGSFFTHLSFPKLTSRGVVDLTMRGVSGARLSGTVALGGQRLATLTDSKVVWQGACAN